MKQKRPPDDPVPATAPASARQRLPWLIMSAAAAVAMAVAVATAGLVLLRSEPVFYRAAVAGPDAVAVEPAARRMMSKMSALHASASRGGPWEAAVTDSEANAWLATDLPRNHAGLLPGGVTEPRVAFLPHRLQLAARVGFGPFVAVAWADIEMWLQGVNQVGMRISAAGLGHIPVPRDAMLHQLALRLARAGLVTDLRRVEGRAVLVVSPPPAYDTAAGGWRLESLAFGSGELLVAGVTGRVVKGAGQE